MKADRTTIYGKYFLNMLGKGRKSDENYVLKDCYTEDIIIYINDFDYKRYARRMDVEVHNNVLHGVLGPSFTMDFNDYVAKTIKTQFHAQIAVYLHFDPSLKRAIDFSREYFDIREDDYDKSAIYKDIQRARKRDQRIPKIYKSLKFLAEVSNLK